MKDFLPQSHRPTRPRPIRNQSRPKPLSNQDVFALVAFINTNDPRYTAGILMTGHTDFPCRAQCFRRDSGASAYLYHSIQGYAADARSQVNDPTFQSALTQWIVMRA